MSSLSDVVVVTISTTGAALSQPAFDVPLILSTSARFTDRIRFYSSMSELEGDGFVTADPEWQVANKLMSQSPHVDAFALGRLANLPTQVFTWVPTAVNGHVYSLEVGLPGGTFHTATYTGDSSATVAEIVLGMKAAIDAFSIAGITTAGISSNTSLTITAPAGDLLHVSNLDRGNATLAQTHADPGVAADLSAISAADDDWYLVLNPFNSTAMGMAIAGWVQARTKAFMADTDDTTSATTSVTSASDLAAQVNAANDNRTFVFANTASDEFAGAALSGQMLTHDPAAGDTWAFKTLAGVASDNWTTSERTNLKARNVTFYYSLANRDVSFQGQVGGGEFFDTIPWGTDALTSDLQVEIATLQFNSAKIPYTDAGIHQIAGCIRTVLDRYVKRGFLASDPKPVVNVPTAASASTQDKAARLLSGVTASAVLARAIHKTQLLVQLT